MSKMIEEAIKDFESEIVTSFPDEYEQGYNAAARKAIEILKELNIKVSEV